MERDEDGVVLSSTRLSGSQWLHRKGDATREAGSLVGPMTAADSPSAISVFRLRVALHAHRAQHDKKCLASGALVVGAKYLRLSPANSHQPLEKIATKKALALREWKLCSYALNLHHQARLCYPMAFKNRYEIALL